MNMRTRIPYADLPSELTALVPVGDFMKAYESENLGNIIVWRRNGAGGLCEEFEYSNSSKRFLSGFERESLFPPVQEITLPELGVIAKISHSLEGESHALYQTYDVASLDSQWCGIHADQQVYAPAMRPVAEVVSEALESALFPARYAAWPRSDKVGYWVGMLYRQRRQTGENGQDEDVIFHPGLLEQMRQTDNQIEDIFPEIIRLLAHMEQRDPVELLAAFNARAGTNF